MDPNVNTAVYPRRSRIRGAKRKPQRAKQLLQEPGSGEIDADSAADHVEGRHGFER
jgi:hypothetical protein